MATRKIADLWLRKVLEILYQRPDVTRSAILEATGLNLASVSHAIRFLLRHGTIRKLGHIGGDGGGGRRREVFSLNPEAAFFIAVDLEGERIRFALLNAKSNICFRWEESADWSEALDVGKLVAGMTRVYDSLPADLGRRVIAAGISFPGLLDEHGRLTAVNLGWRDFPLADVLGERTRGTPLAGIPVFLQAHRDSFALAERSLGCAQECEDGLLLFGQRGIGMGIFSGGRGVTGWRKMAGEIGHITIDPASAELCRCGKRGCLETFASTPAMLRHYGAPVNIAELYDRARAGEPAALETVTRAGRALGLGLSHAISILNPRMIILSGEMARGADLLVPVIREELERHTLPGLLHGLSITSSTLGLDVRLNGAGAFAFRKALADPALLRKLTLNR